MVTCNRISRVKEKVTIRHPKTELPASALNEAVELPSVGLSIPVRAAKAMLSALLEVVAGGQEPTITSGGKPKAVLRPVSQRRPRTVFTGPWEQLRNRQVVERAGALIEQCYPGVLLRTLDAIHLATVELHGGEQMCSSDQRVCAAADIINLFLVPPPKTT